MLVEVLYALVFCLYAFVINDVRIEERDKRGNLVAFYRGFRWFSPPCSAIFFYSVYDALFTGRNLDLPSIVAMISIGLVLGLFPAMYFWFRRISLVDGNIHGIGPFNGRKVIPVKDISSIKEHGDKRLGRWSTSGATISGNGVKIEIEGFLSGYRALIEAIKAELEREGSSV